MIRITRQTDYGIAILAYLAAKPIEAIHTARDVAGVSHVPLPMASKILKILAREGLLISHRGVKGGYSLARHPNGIMIGEVIRALEGHIGITECASHPGSCEHELICPVRTNWQRVNSAVREVLERIPLSDMMAPSSPELIRLGEPSILATPGVC